MQINNILYLVGKYLGDKDLVSETEGSTSSSEGREVVNSYIGLLNLVQKRLATEWFVLRTKEIVETKSQKILFGDLTMPYYKLIKIVHNGKSVNFELLSDGVELPDGEYEIWYQYLPNDVSYSEGKVFDFNGRVSDRIYALGVVAEYCLLNGMYDTSNYFEEKFLNSLNSLKVVSSHKNMPKRRWL